MDTFEQLLSHYRPAVERLIRYRIPNPFDAEDVLQEACLLAMTKFHTLKDPAAFQPWILTIARNKCNEYFRKNASHDEISLDALAESGWEESLEPDTPDTSVQETLSALKPTQRNILHLYYYRSLSHAEISKVLGIPTGTVKSRLYTAREQFRRRYPYPPIQKGVCSMEKFPHVMPAYQITPNPEPPFPVRHEELPGMLIIPKLNQRLSFAMYDFPERTCTGMYTQQVTGKVTIHGMEGVTISSKYTDEETTEENTIFAQLTPTNCRYLGGMSKGENGELNIVTFLDGDTFAAGYGIGDNNCGFEVNRAPANRITADNGCLFTQAEGDVSDIVGRFTVTMADKSWDTVRLVDLEINDGDYMLCEYYLDHSGRTVLWRRFNRDDWALDRYGQRWSEKLPNNERLTLNGDTYVHWYDCITDYVL